MPGQGIASGPAAELSGSPGRPSVVASAEALARGWVRQEVDIALDERGRSRDFHLVLLRLAEANVDELVRGLSWIDVPDGTLTPEVAASILTGFHPVERWPDPSTSRDVYVSASWQGGDNVSALTVCRQLAASGFRLIGDSKSQRGFSGDRIASIMGSCGAAVVVIPYRGNDRARAGEAPYKYFLQEHDQAKKLELPLLAIADPRIRREDGDDSGWLRMPTDADTCSPEIGTSIEALWGRVAGAAPPASRVLRHRLGRRRRSPRQRRPTAARTRHRNADPHRVRDPGTIATVRNHADDCRCVPGDRRHHRQRSRPIFNLDVCIEAGMALVKGSTLALMAAVPVHGRETPICAYAAMGSWPT